MSEIERPAGPLVDARRGEPGFHEIAAGANPSGGPGSPAPGDTCPTCERRLPHPKKESSPASRTRSYRVPLDEDEAHGTVLESAAKHLGTYERPHWQFQTLTLALALVLQDESLRGFANRAAA